MADQVRIYTFKEGLLSRVAHDLRLHVEPGGVSVHRDGQQVRAELDPNQIVVDGAVTSSGRLDADALSRRDRAKIVDTIQTEILATRRHPQIRFVGTVDEQGERLQVRGELELVGVRRPLGFALTREGQRLTARVSLRPSEFGVAPYKALAGAIRLQDRLEIELELDPR